MSFRRLMVMTAAAAALGLATEARAADPCWGGGGCGGAPFYPFYAQYGREHIPYFALHPPVYYSYPVPRSYGYSPFAYPLGSPTPEIELAPPKVEKKPEPKTMLNQFVDKAPVKETSASEASQARAAQSEPKVVYNPYFTAPVATARN